jgi:chromosome segregation ATPase
MPIESEFEKPGSTEVAPGELDPKRESRESREDFEMDAAGEAAAAMERAEYIVKDVKSTKQQMKNIVMNMHAVKQQIRQLRKQLQLASDDDATSLDSDKNRVDELRQKISGYQYELVAMRDDLIREQVEELRTQGSLGNVEEEAELLIDRMIADVMDES